MPDVNILQRNWNEVRKTLKNSKASGDDRAALNPEERRLRKYLGNKKFEKLRDLTLRGDQIRDELGMVILIPGIMGSNLVSVNESGDEDTIWLGLKSLALGGLSRLELNEDGKTSKNKENIKVSSIFGGLFAGFFLDYYSLALETLQAEPFSYDWRMDVRIAAQQLGEFIKQKLTIKEEKISLVAHSMGGLVARSFINQFPNLWERIKGNLIMVGTPNRGSFDAVQALIGKNRTIQKLDTFDIFHRLDRLMEIFHSFPGLYQLLPEKSFDPRIYQPETWGGFPSVKFNSHLLDVEKFHQELIKVIDKERMFYIAGTGFETLQSLKAINNSEFEFESSFDGDGTVPHRLGILEEITTFYDNENEHSDLLNGEKVLAALKDLIKDGQTQSLPLDKTKLNGVGRGKSRSATISLEDEALIDAISGAIRAGEELEPEQLAEIERKLQRSIWGGREFDTDENDIVSTPPKKIKVEISEHDISDFTEEISVVGKYLDLPPRGACSDIDQKLDYQISLAYQTGMIGSELGQLFFVPEKLLSKLKSNQDAKPNPTVILAGAGSYGKFRRDDLRYLVMNAAFAVLSLKHNRFGLVMIGTGLNDFSIDRAVRSVLSGIADAIDQFPEEKHRKSPPTMELVIFENNGKRFDDIKTALETLAGQQKKQPIENVKLIFDAKEGVHRLTDLERAEKEAKAKDYSTKQSPLPFWVLTEKEKNVTRVTVERDYEKQEFLLSALTSTAAIPTRQISIQNCIIDSLTEKIRRAGNAEKQKQYGRLLHSMLIPEDFQGLIDTNKPLVLSLDSSSASIPWEMLSYGGSRGFSTFGVELQMSRQFSMSAAMVASVAPPVNDECKVLIIADPAPGDLSLDGAAREGRELKVFFEELNKNNKDLTIKVDSCIGASECDIVDVLTKIFTVEYDLIHFSGHGHYDKDDDTNSGWVFGSRKVKVKMGNEEKEIEKLLVISPREIFRLRKVPRLVFANACFTSQVSDGNILINQGVSVRETARRLSGIAEAFFARGIQNYIGAGWQVNDSLAVNFAKIFYKHALNASENHEIDTLSIALKKAREEIKKQVDNTTWGAYQHYGDANTKFIYVSPKKKDEKKGGKK